MPSPYRVPHDALLREVPGRGRLRDVRAEAGRGGVRGAERGGAAVSVVAGEGAGVVRSGAVGGRRVGSVDPAAPR